MSRVLAVALHGRLWSPAMHVAGGIRQPSGEAAGSHEDLTASSGQFMRFPTACVEVAAQNQAYTQPLDLRQILLAGGCGPVWFPLSVWTVG